MEMLLFLLLIFILLIIYSIIRVFKHNDEIKALTNKLNELKTLVMELQENFNYSESHEAKAKETHISEIEKTISTLKNNNMSEHPETNDNLVESSVVKKEDVISEQKTSVPLKNAAPKKTSAIKLYFKSFCSIESIISKLGIILLLIGVGYGFKLTYDYGYITPEITLVLGSLLGATVSYFGLYANRKNRIILSHILLGGATAIFYITVYAGYLHYQLFGTALAFVFLNIITFFAYTVSMATNQSTTAILGFSGGLLIPFMVGMDFLGLSGFGLYVFVLSMLSTIVYFIKRWRILQISSISAVLITLTVLLMKASLSVLDSQLFIVLIVALWIIHTAPDFYFHLKGLEKKKDKNYSPIYAIINFLFSFICIYKLSVYQSVPQGSMYIGFAILYGLIASICIQKKGVSNLSFSYTAGTLIFVYTTIIELLTYDVQPAVVLSVALALYWFWRKEKNNKLRIFAHIMGAVGYAMAFYSLLQNYNNISSGRFALQALVYFIPMGPIVFLQEKKHMKILQTLIFQVYVYTILLLLSTQIMSPILISYKYTHSYDILLLYALITAVLFLIYSFINLKKDNWFYKKSFYLMPILLFCFSLIFSLYVINFKISDNIKFLRFTAIIIIKVILILSLIINARLKNKEKKNKTIHLLFAFFIIVIASLIDVRIITYDFRWNLLCTAVIILLADKFWKTEIKTINALIKNSKIIIMILTFSYYCYFFNFMQNSTNISIISLVLNISIALLFLMILKTFKIHAYVYFAAITIIFVFISIIDVYIPIKNNGLLTLLWGFYSISIFLYHLIKGNRELVYAGLVLIVIVACKLIFIDLQTISTFYKFLTSVVFGLALLGVSYAIQPLMNKFSKMKTKKYKRLD